MYISNSKGETPLSILVDILNRIKEAKMAEVTDDDVMNYLENKKNYPKTKKDEQVVRASLYCNTNPKIEEPPNPDDQSSSILPTSSPTSNISNLKLTLINRRKKKPIPTISPSHPPLPSPSQDSSPLSPFRNFLNKVKSPFAVKKKEAISFQETIKDLEEGASFIKMRKVDEGERKEGQEGRTEEEGNKEEDENIMKLEGRIKDEEEGKRRRGGRKEWREDEEEGGRREEESKDEDGGEERDDEEGDSTSQVFTKRKIQIKVRKTVNKAKFCNK